MSKCRTTRKNSQCGVTVVQEPAAKGCAPFNVCLAFGRSLTWNGNCFTVQGTPTIEDGWYGEVLVENGCIVDARAARIPTYTPAPCAPVPGECGKGGGSAGVTLSPDACNLLEYQSGMLLSKLYFGDSSGVTVTGCGTRNSPLQFSFSSDSDAVNMKSGSPQVITVEGDGSIAAPFTIGMTTVELAAGQYGAFEIDAYGRIIGYDESRTGLIEGVNNGDGVNLSVTGGVLQADLVDVPDVAGQYTTGGYMLTVDNKGRVTNLRREITIDPDTYRLGNFDVTLNEYGSVTAIEQVAPDNSAIPDTFVGSFRGAVSSTDTEREMTFTTELDGPIHVEYRGLLGRTALDPGMTMTLPAGFGIAIDGISLADPLIEVAGVFSSDGVGANAIVAIRATSMNVIAAGQHTVTVTTPTAVVTQRDGFMRAQIVGRGA